MRNLKTLIKLAELKAHKANNDVASIQLEIQKNKNSIQQSHTILKRETSSNLEAIILMKPNDYLVKLMDKIEIHEKTLQELNKLLEQKKRILRLAISKLKRYELLHCRHQRNTKKLKDQQEQKLLDEIGLLRAQLETTPRY